MDGFIFLNKEVGLTSREACDKVGRVLGIKKVGHIGTLDPFATGLLLIMINKATRCAQFFDEFDKGYIATISLGEERDSLDVTGQVINQKEVPNLSIEEEKKHENWQENLVSSAGARDDRLAHGRDAHGERGRRPLHQGGSPGGGV